MSTKTTTTTPRSPDGTTSAQAAGKSVSSRVASVANAIGHWLLRITRFSRLNRSDSSPQREYAGMAARKAMGPMPAPLSIGVKFMGDLPAVTGQRRIQVTLPDGSTVGDLLESLSQRYGDGFRCRIFSNPTKLHHTMVIFVDGANIRERGGLAAKLGDSEVEVIMLPIIEGG